MFYGWPKQSVAVASALVQLKAALRVELSLWLLMSMSCLRWRSCLCPRWKWLRQPQVVVVVAAAELGLLKGLQEKCRLGCVYEVQEAGCWLAWFL